MVPDHAVLMEMVMSRKARATWQHYPFKRTALGHRWLQVSQRRAPPESAPTRQRWLGLPMVARLCHLIGGDNSSKDGNTQIRQGHCPVAALSATVASLSQRTHSGPIVTHGSNRSGGASPVSMLSYPYAVTSRNQQPIWPLRGIRGSSSNDDDFLKRLVLPRSVSGLVRDEIYAVPY